MYPPIYRKRRHRSATDLHVLKKRSQSGLKKQHSVSQLRRKKKPRSLSFRVGKPSTTNTSKPLNRSALKRSKCAWTKIRKATFSHRLFNQSMNTEQKRRRVEDLYKRLHLKADSLPQDCEEILLFDPREKVDMADATMFVTLNHPIESFTEQGKQINFLLSARFGVFNQIFHFFFGYDEEPNTYINLAHSTKLKLFQKHGAKENFNWKFHHGNNVMHECAFGANRDILDMLLDHDCGVDINCSNILGYTPLQVAAKKRNYYTVFRLIMEGADVDYTSCKSCAELLKTMSNTVKGESLAVSVAMKQFELRLHGQYHHGSELSVRSLCQRNPTLHEIVSAAEKQLSQKKLSESLSLQRRPSFLARTASMATFASNMKDVAKGSAMKSLIKSRARINYHRYQTNVDPSLVSNNCWNEEDSPKPGLVDFNSWRKSKKISAKGKRRTTRRRSAMNHSNSLMVVARPAGSVTSQWNPPNK